jgi:hypothetical protein
MVTVIALSRLRFATFRRRIATSAGEIRLDDQGMTP